MSYCLKPPTNRMRIRLFLPLLLLATLSSLSAQPLPLVQVDVSLAASGYRDAFASPDAQLRFETELARSVEGLLGEQLKFIRFGPGPAAQRLHVRLQREATQSSTQLAAILFNLA